MITIKGKDFSYDESQIINFAEGLIGLPEMRRAVLIAMDEFEPFCWLASIESEKTRFIVVDPNDVFAAYKPFDSDAGSDEKLKMLAIVNVSSDWQKTTVNLRAPLVINQETLRGAQLVLTDSSYQFGESLIQN
ncbi:flagellar assembly protein FliW [soil metagenome]